MTPTDIAEFWKKTAQEDWDTAEALFTIKRYHHALFFCHLAVEKILKGLIYAKTHTHPLPIHQLVKLATQANMSLTLQREHQLDEIASWNIEARYDSYKRKFYKKATKEFTAHWMDVAKEFFVWTKNQY
jgi:HEPN domain-containing protein